MLIRYLVYELELSAAVEGTLQKVDGLGSKQSEYAASVGGPEDGLGAVVSFDGAALLRN